MLVPHDRRIVQHWARTGVLILAVVLVIDLAAPHKAHFAWLGPAVDTWPLFHPLLGFASTLALVLISKTLGLVLSRPESYYAE